MPSDTSKTNSGKQGMEELKPIWDKIDRHSNDIAKLTEKQNIHDYRLDRHEKEMTLIANKTQESVQQILTEVKHIGDKVRNNELSAAFNKGAEKAKGEATTWKRWFIGLLVPSLLTIAGLAYALTK